MKNSVLELCRGPNIEKVFLQLSCKLTYIFVDIDFLGFSKNTDFHFYISKEFMNIEGIFI